MELMLRPPKPRHHPLMRGISGLGGGAVANYTSGEADQSLGYCRFIMSQPDPEKFASAYGRKGCRDYQICLQGGVPPMDGVEHCGSTIGGNTCCDANGQNCFPVGEGCAALNTIVTSWAGHPLGQPVDTSIPPTPVRTPLLTGAVPISTVTGGGAPATGGTLQIPSAFNQSVSIGGMNIPILGLIAGALVLFLVVKK